MNQEQRQAYEWAKNQDYPSVAARYAKILAGLVDEITPPNEPLTLEELREMDGEPVYDAKDKKWHVIETVGNCFVEMTDGAIFDSDIWYDNLTDRLYRHPLEGEEEDTK